MADSLFPPRNPRGVGIIMRGLPGSGKTTLAKAHEKEGYVRISRDDLREQHPELHEGQITDLFDEKLGVALSAGVNVVLDNTHLHEPTFNKYLNKLTGAEYSVITEDMGTSWCDCIRQDQQRREEGGRYVGRSVIIKMAMDYGRFYHARLKKTRLEMHDRSRKCVLFDLDGTLCDVEHRRHFLIKDEVTGRKNWRAFELGCVDDTLKEAVADLYRLAAKEYTVILVSGRKDHTRRLTEEWLERHGLNSHFALFMRNRNDNRDDAIVKKEIHDKYIAPWFDVQWVVDDRNRVVDMWRALGYTTFQCAPGDF